MLTKTITYTDFNDETRTETFYFNMTKAEALKWQMSKHGGLQKFVNALNENSHPEIIELYEDIIDRSYGVKSPDGRAFLKDPNSLAVFKGTEAYSALFMEIAGDIEKFQEFLVGIMPKEFRGSLTEMNKKLIDGVNAGSVMTLDDARRIVEMPEQ